MFGGKNEKEDYCYFYVSWIYFFKFCNNINYWNKLTSSDEKYNGPGFNIGALLNIDFFHGFGIQTELSTTVFNFKIQKDQLEITVPLSIIDVPIMMWWNGKFNSIGIGLGAGINFGFVNYNPVLLNLGFTFGSNVIFYFGNHIGLLVGFHGVFDFPKGITFENDYNDTTIGFSSSDWVRNTLFGKVGIIYRF